MSRLPLRKRIVRTILTGIFGRRKPASRIDPSDLQRILLMRYDRLGDLVITTPLIDAIRSVAPHVKIDLLAGKRNKMPARFDERFDEVIVFDGGPVSRWKSIRACRRRRYDCVFQLLLWRTTLPGILARLVARNSPVVSRVHPVVGPLFDFHYKVDSTAHYAVQTFGFLEVALNVGPQRPGPYSIVIPDEARHAARRTLESIAFREGEYVIVNASAGQDSKRLNRNRLAELISEIKNSLEERSLSVLVIGTADDGAVMTELSRAVDSDGVRSWSGNLFQAIALIEMARAVVTPDTATTHLASAVMTPTVVYFNWDGRPKGWGPRGVPGRCVVARQGPRDMGMDDSDFVNRIAGALTDLLSELQNADASTDSEHGEE